MTTNFVERVAIEAMQQAREELDRRAVAIAALKAENTTLREALQECTRLSGADLSDGFPTWPKLPEFAVESVREMRETYDEDAAVVKLQTDFDALLTAARHLLDCSQASEPFEVEALASLERAVFNCKGGRDG